MDGFQSKVPNDALSSPEQAEDDIAVHTVRSYDCIYCKRGFTTAQALGGHMNIHRRDRVRTRRNREPPAPVKTKDHPYNVGYKGYYKSYTNYRAFHLPVSEFIKNYTIHFPSASSDVSKDVGVAGICSRRAQGHSLYGQDLGLGLGTNVYDRGLEDVDDGLDLELRLGYE